MGFAFRSAGAFRAAAVGGIKSDAILLLLRNKEFDAAINRRMALGSMKNSDALQGHSEEGGAGKSSSSNNNNNNDGGRDMKDLYDKEYKTMNVRCGKISSLDVGGVDNLYNVGRLLDAFHGSDDRQNNVVKREDYDDFNTLVPYHTYLSYVKFMQTLKDLKLTSPSTKFVVEPYCGDGLQTVNNAVWDDCNEMDDAWEGNGNGCDDGAPTGSTVYVGIDRSLQRITKVTSSYDAYEKRVHSSNNINNQRSEDDDKDDNIVSAFYVKGEELVEKTSGGNGHFLDLRGVCKYISPVRSSAELPPSSSYEQEEVSKSNVVILIRAEVTSFVTMLHWYHKSRRLSIKKWNIYYPNPYPKTRRYNSRWYGNVVILNFKDASFSPEIEVRTNWETGIRQAAYAMKEVCGRDAIVEEVKGRVISGFEGKYRERNETCWKATF